jgi:MFS family permease
MPLLPTLGRTVGTGVRAVRMLVRGSVRGGAWATRRVGDARAKGAANEIGMVRLFDLHAISCAGDTLIAIGLAGTIFFNVPLGEARSKVALYLLITMVPFALLAPVVGPLLDHFRHGRRWALAATMLGRAFLAYVISDNLFGWGLYPAAFGVLALSRAYGVARSAAVPRLLPDGVGLSQVGARASVYGTFAGAVVAPIGLAAFWFGPQWPLRVASVIFVVGMVISLRLPPRADSDPPEEVPRPFRTMLRLRRGPDRPLSGALVVNTLIGSASLRLLYGFLLLYFAFAIKAGDLATTVAGRDFGSQGAVALIGGALAVGTFLATAIGTRMRIRRPTALQSSGLTITAGVAVLATIFYTLPMVALLSLVAAVFSGVSKLAIDASIQERVPERLRASAFAHSETVLMIAWVIGGAVGIIPFTGRVGVAVAAAIAVAAALRAGYVAARLHGERLHGRPDVAPDPDAADRIGDADAGDRSGEPADPWPDAPTVAPPARGAGPARRPAPPPRSGATAASRHVDPLGSGRPHPPGSRDADPASTSSRGTLDPASTSSRGTLDPASTSSRSTVDPATASSRGAAAGDSAPRSGSRRLDPTLVEPPKRRFGRWRKARPAADTGPADTGSPSPEPSAPTAPLHPPAAEAPPTPDPAMAPPGFHIYRPSSATDANPDPGRPD